MRRPNRNIEIFSMSVLDLFASALGGFIMISIILFPNYMKQENTAVKLEQAKEQLKQTQSKLDKNEDELRSAALAKEQQSAALNQCKAEQSDLQKQVAASNQQLQQNDPLRRELASCQAALASTFIVVSIEWSLAGGFDVDLHVTDPQGREFYYAKSNRSHTEYPDTDAQLSYDNTRGPGVELWQSPKAQPGTYVIAYDYYSGAANVEVKGNVFYRNGRKELPAVTLTSSQRRRSVANIIVGQNGNVEVRLLL